MTTTTTPSLTCAPVDILTFLALPAATALTSGWQDGSYDVLQPGKWTRVKNAQGWPWDIKLYDEQFVYDWITEQDWTSPRDYKKHVMNHLGPDGKTLQDGMTMFPRYITLPGPASPSWTPPIISQIDTPAARTTFRIFTNCKWDNVTHNVGDVRHTLLGPIGFDHGGNVGYQPTLVHQYCWGGKNGTYSTMEENFYVLNFGWLRWTLYNLTNGSWKQVNQSIHNQLVTAKLASVQFPCF